MMRLMRKIADQKGWTVEEVMVATLEIIATRDRAAVIAFESEVVVVNMVGMVVNIHILRVRLSPRKNTGTYSGNRKLLPSSQLRSFGCAFRSLPLQRSSRRCLR